MTGISFRITMFVEIALDSYIEGTSSIRATNRVCSSIGRDGYLGYSCESRITR